MLNTRTGENYNANDVINSNDLRKRLLNIDTRFRTNIADKCTDIQYRLDHTYRNVIKLRVASVEIPNMFYVFSEAKKNTSFMVQTTDKDGITRTLTVTIPDGNYSISDLVVLIQAQFDTGFKNPYGIFLTITINVNNAKITINHNGLSAYPVTSSTTVPSISANPISFNFQTSQFNTERNFNFGLGYNLGFRKKLYTLTTPTSTSPFNTYTFTSEAVVDTVGDTYLFLQLNDLHTVEHRTSSNYMQYLAKIIVREDKTAIIYDDGSSLMSNEIIFPSPVDLTVLNIRLVDAYGEVVDMNGTDFSFTLEITEVLNVKLYDFYRNYIWLGTIPTIPYKSAVGSSQALYRGGASFM